MSTLKQTFDLLLGDDVAVFDYADEAVFKRLWLEPPPTGLVLFLWSTTPPDIAVKRVNTSEHLTPFHCVATWRPSTERRVAVLDLQPSGHRANYLVQYVCQLRHRKRKQVNHVQAADLFSSHDVIELRTALFPENDGAGVQLNEESLLECFQNHLFGLKEAHSQHAISNLIVPLWLNSAAEESMSLHRRALSRLVETLGVPRNEPDTQSGSTGVEVPPTKHEKRKLIIHLVDDQWTHGWLQWLQSQAVSSAIFANYDVQVNATDDPFLLLKRVKELENVPDPKRQSSGNLSLFPAKDNPQSALEILFLDLRLFVGRNRDEEHFLREFGGIDLRPSPDSTGAVLALADRIAALDPLYPIILFSSTHRADLIRKVGKAANIITDFSKPSLRSLMSGADTVNPAIALESAFAKANALLRTREVFRKVSEAGTFLTRLDALRSCKHFEVFLDEAGRPGEQDFRVGAVLLGYEGEEHVLQVENHLKSVGLRYPGDPLDTSEADSPEPVNAGSRKARDRQTILARYERVVSERHLVAIPIILYCNPKNSRSRDPGIRSQLLDSQFYDLTKTLLEVLLVDVLANRLNGDDETPTLRIHGATRRFATTIADALQNDTPKTRCILGTDGLLHKRNQDGTSDNIINVSGKVLGEIKNMVEELRSFWGIGDSEYDIDIEKRSVNILYQSLGSQILQQLVGSVLGSRPDAPGTLLLALAIDTVRAVTLGHDSAIDQWAAYGKPHRMHYLADHLVGGAIETNGQVEVSSIDGDMGFEPMAIRNSDAFDCLISAVRAADRQDFRSTVVLLEQMFTLKPEDGWDMTGIYADEIADCLLTRIRTNIESVPAASIARLVLSLDLSERSSISLPLSESALSAPGFYGILKVPRGTGRGKRPKVENLIVWEGASRQRIGDILKTGNDITQTHGEVFEICGFAAFERGGFFNDCAIFHVSNPDLRSALLAHLKNEFNVGFRACTGADILTDPAGRPIFRPRSLQGPIIVCPKETHEAAVAPNQPSDARVEGPAQTISLLTAGAGEEPGASILQCSPSPVELSANEAEGEITETFYGLRFRMAPVGIISDELSFPDKIADRFGTRPEKVVRIESKGRRTELHAYFRERAIRDDILNRTKVVWNAEIVPDLHL